jgi:hypothetical protein
MLRERLSRLGDGPLSFWFLNHELETAELTRQLEELKDKGFSGVLMHPRGGLLVPYGSHHWYEAVGHCISEARRIGLEAWLYDEDPYPSGAAGGKVLFENPELKASCLEHRVLKIQAPGRHVLDLPNGSLVGAYLVQGNNITPVDKFAGIVRTHWSQYYTSDSYHPVHASEGFPHWRAGTSQPHYRIMVEVADVDEPTYLVGFTRRYSPQHPWGGYPDPLNPKAVAAFTNYTHDEYADRFEGDFGGVVPGIFTDEFKLFGKLPWTAEIDSLFFEVGHVDLMEVLPHLVLSLSPDTPFIRWAYRETLARAFLANFARPLQRCCESHGLLSTGHISPEEAPLLQSVLTPGYMRVLAQFDIPGTDFIGHTFGSERRPLYHISPKLASSVAHAASKPFVLCEAFAVADWTQDFAFLTKVTNWLFALGVNRIVTHGQFYSIDGLRKREAPPSQFFQASYWEHFHAYSASITFLTEQLTQGCHEAPLLLYYPEESFMALSFEEHDATSTVGLTLEKEFGNLVGDLLAKGFDFDLVDWWHLLKVRSDGDLLISGDECFKAIVVPGLYLREESWNMLQRFQQDGIRVFFIEKEVTILTSSLRKQKVACVSLDKLLGELSTCVNSVWNHPSQSLVGHKRITEKGALLFLCNTGSEEVRGPVELSFAGPYEVCAYTSSREWRASGEVVELNLSPGQGILIRQRQLEAPPKYVAAECARSIPTEWNRWSASPMAGNCLVLHQFRVISRASGADRPVGNDFLTAPVIDLLSPTMLSYAPPDARNDRYLHAAFDWQGPVAKLRLVHDTELDPRAGGMEFSLNDHPLPSSIRRHTYDPMNREVEITNLIRPGRNILTWVQKGVDVESLPWPYDAVRIFGDFQVDFPHGCHAPPALRSRPPAYSCGTPTSPTLLGHPHYNGLFCYEVEFRLEYLPERIALRCQGVYETMNVHLNGIDCGHLWVAPYFLEIDVCNFLQGRNKLSLYCSTSPANYLQVMNRPAGPIGPIEWCEL